MNNDLISRSALKEGIACHRQYTDQKYETDRQWAIGYNSGIERALFSITYAPAVDAEPVRHGRWIKKIGCVKCSICFEDCWADSAPSYEFCPRCGARMDGGAEDAVD